mmetsp:Transcript_3415/g.7364  ORF Transcript_3415/g.7364 Transcript_3415/m.7364 type:complete len:198 (+) Transcript_3415:726-1319(+)
MLHQIQYRHAVSGAGGLGDPGDENITGRPLKGHAPAYADDRSHGTVKDPVDIREVWQAFECCRAIGSALKNCHALASDYPHGDGRQKDGTDADRPQDPKFKGSAGFDREEKMMGDGPGARRYGVENEHQRGHSRQLAGGRIGCPEDPIGHAHRHGKNGVIGPVGPYGIVEHGYLCVVVEECLSIDFVVDFSARQDDG